MKVYLENIKFKGYSPVYPDYEDTNIVLKSVDGVISPLSTILLEALIVGKPIICFMPLDEVENKRIKIVSEFPFFKDFFSSKEVLLAKSLKQVIEKVPSLLNKKFNSSDNGNLEILKDRIIKTYKEPYETRILELVENIYKKTL